MVIFVRTDAAGAGMVTVCVNYNRFKALERWDGVLVRGGGGAGVLLVPSLGHMQQSVQLSC